jgi:hypothetical protein
MAEAAVATLLRSAAPGQFDAVAETIAKLGTSGIPKLADVKHEHETFQCIGISSQKVTHPLAAKLKEKLKSHQETCFGSSGSKVTARVALLPGASDSQFIVQTYAEKLDLANQYTGYWKATWTVTATSGDVAEVKGDVQLHTYSYEDGNIQLKTEKTFEGTLVEERENGPEEDASLANGILHQIIEWEHDVLEILKGLHDLSADHLRHIRRVLPITKTKMKWEVAAQRSVTHMRKTAKKHVNIKK